MPNPHDRKTARTPYLTLLVALAAPALAQQDSRPQTANQRGNPTQGTTAQKPTGSAPKADLSYDDLHILDPMAPKGRRFFDGVIAMVGDRVILHSTIRTEVGASVAGRLNAKETVDASTIVELAQRALKEHLSGEVMAQSARLTDSMTPTELKEWLNAELARFLNDMIANFGSYSSYLSALEESHTTWEEEAQRHIDQMLAHRSTAQIYANVLSRAGDRSNLWVTPREMRRFYDQNRAEFRHDRTVELDRVLFVDAANAKAQAAAAAEAWRANPRLGPEDVAAAHNGSAKPPWIVEDRTAKDFASFVQAFAKDAKPLQVSEPIGSNGSYWVLRVRRVQERSDLPFTDPEVQKAIAGKLHEAERVELSQRLFERNRTGLFWFVEPTLWRY